MSTLTQTVGRHQYALVVDTTKCIGCEACSVACRVENEVPDGHWRSRVMAPTAGGAKVPLKWSCMHCADAPCVRVCPTQATYRRPDGIVVIDAAKCVGCKYCIVACPSGARYFDEKKGIPDKCDLCVGGVGGGTEPGGGVPGWSKDRTMTELDGNGVVVVVCLPLRTM